MRCWKSDIVNFKQDKKVQSSGTGTKDNIKSHGTWTAWRHLRRTASSDIQSDDEDHHRAVKATPMHHGIDHQGIATTTTTIMIKEDEEIGIKLGGIATNTKVDTTIRTKAPIHMTHRTTKTEHGTRNIRSPYLSCDILR